MKMERRWVAWMAALGMAALLLATPRQGTAGPHPYIMPTDPPALGEPDTPGHGSRLLWFRIKTFVIAVRIGPLPNVIVIPVSQRAVSARSEDRTR